MKFTNIENLSNYDFSTSKKNAPPGVSAMLRVKNEEATITPAILSIIDLVNEIVVIDNSSTDNTVQIVEQLSSDNPDKIKLAHYPFTITRCGYEFASTPENSIKSTAYYYNWCKSLCRYSHLLKWDADMVLPEKNVSRWKEIRDHVLKGKEAIYQPMGRLIVIDKDRKFRDSRENFREPRLYPNTSDFYYVKADDCFTERISYQGKIFETCKDELNMIYSDQPDFYEIKDTNKNEFEHFGKDELHLEVKQSRESMFLVNFRSNEENYETIDDDPYLNLIV